MNYNRPIIIELYADLHLSPGTFPFACFFDVVPELGRRGFTIVESGEADQAAPPGTGADSSRLQLVRCWSEDRSRLVQLAPDNVVMNLVSPDGTYPGWMAFLTNVVQPTIQSLTDSLSSWQPQSVALSTLDRTTIPFTSSFTLGEYLNCGGPRVPSILAETRVAFDYDVGRGLLSVDGRNRQLHINGRPSLDSSYTITIHAVFHDHVSEVSDLVGLLNRLHDESNTWFESLITPRMRSEIMKGETHANSSL